MLHLGTMIVKRPSIVTMGLQNRGAVSEEAIGAAGRTRIGVVWRLKEVMETGRVTDTNYSVPGKFAQRLDRHEKLKRRDDATACGASRSHGLMPLEVIATLCTGLFTGAAVYVNLVEHPARLETGTAHAVRQWRPSYRPEP
jgi:hypothetical protein